MPIILTFFILFFSALNPVFAKEYSIEELLKIAEENRKDARTIDGDAFLDSPNGKPI